MYGLLGGMIFLMLMLSMYLVRGHKEVIKALAEKADKLGLWDGFLSDLQTKYKIVLRLVQTLSKITVLYPEVMWPSAFSQIFTALDGAWEPTDLLFSNCSNANCDSCSPSGIWSRLSHSWSFL